MSLFDPATSRATDTDGNPISGATWNFALTGSLTPASVYSEADLSVSLGATVTADSGGLFVPIYLDDAVSYRAILKDAGGATIIDIDPVNAAGASTTDVLTGTSASKFATPDSVAALWEQGANVASASAISLGEGGYFVITGTTSITDIDLGTDKAGRTVWLRFSGILTLTHSGTTLILPTSANITTAAGDTACFVSEGSDVVRCLAYLRADGSAIAGGGSYSGGKQTIPILASAMQRRTTNGAAEGSTETATNKIMVASLDFDQTTAEYAQLTLPMPKSWNESTVTAQFVWTATTTGSVVWGCQAVAISDDDVLDAAFGTAQTVTDAVTAANDVMISAETSAITIGGTPAEGDIVVFQFYRDAASGSDTLAADAKLLSVKLFITTNAATDA